MPSRQLIPGIDKPGSISSHFGRRQVIAINSYLPLDYNTPDVRNYLLDRCHPGKNGREWVSPVAGTSYGI
jgi:hypothetical protein